jgi:vacuolar-type H+-ATPase catalytic subunit A/Vma1
MISSSFRSYRMKNVASQRISAYKRNLEEVVSQDPAVREFRQRQQHLEVNNEVVQNMTRDMVKNKKKKKVTQQSSLSSILDEQPEQPQRAYKFRQPSKQLKQGIRVTFFDKSFERDCL